MKVWVEVGGDTGGAEVYAEPGAKIAKIDWDDWNNHPDEVDFDQVFHWLEVFGGVMPEATRAELLTRLKPDAEWVWPGGTDNS